MASAMLAPDVFAQRVSIEEIVVTARKRSESLLEIPLAITAFSTQQMEKMGTANLVELSKFTPGLQFNEQGVQEPGRVYTAIRFRGLGSEIKEPFGQVGSAFLDGMYMAGGVSSLGTEMFERVEVVKGPSSAWLGRSTFAGAINFITKNPNLDEYQGRLSVKYAEDATFDSTLYATGPLVAGKLGFGAMVRGYNTHGQFTASDGGRLGAERTDSMMATLFATPTDNLRIKVRGIYSRDNDGAPAQAYVVGPDGLRGNNPGALTNCFAQNPQWRTLFKRNQANQGLLTDFICGQVPNKLSLVDSNTTVTAEFLDFWRRLTPASPGVPDIDHVGLRRNQKRFMVEIGYDFQASGFLDGASLNLVAGDDDEGVGFIRDFDVTPVPNWLSRDPSHNQSRQYEARLTSGQENDFTWAVGLSYFKAEFQSTYQGGETIIGTDGGLTAVLLNGDLDSAFGRVPDNRCPCFFPPLTIGPENGGLTKGVFGSLGYDFTNELSVDFEWRYQKDKVTVLLPGTTSLAGFPVPVRAFGTGNGAELGRSFSTFLPRVTLQYKPTDETNIYAAFSRGNNPGFFNADIVNRPASDIVLVLAARDTDVFVGEERLDNYEIGWKQKAFDSRVSTAVTGYHMKWSNQKTRSGETINRPDGSQIAANLVIGGFSTEFWGIEFEGSAAATDEISFDASLSWNDATFKNFSCGFTDDYAPADARGNLICDGNRPVQSPAWTGSLATTLQDNLSGDWDYFVRADVTYTGKRFVDEKNFAFIGAQWLSNLRIGILKEDFRIEGFVTNLLNNKTWLAGNRWTNFSADKDGLFPFEFTNAQGIALSAPRLRQFGLRASYNF